MVNINCRIINIKLKGKIFHSFCNNREQFKVTMLIGNTLHLVFLSLRRLLICII